MFSKTILISLCFAFLFSEVLLCDQNEIKDSKNILVIFSFSPSTPAYKILIDEIREKLLQEFGDSYKLHLEYLETEQYANENYLKERFDLCNNKYRNVNLDLLICIGIDVITPIKKYADGYLLNLPTISFDYDFSDIGYERDLILNNQTALIKLKLDIDATLSYALKLFPKTSSIYFISGVSKFDNQLYLISKQSAKKIKGKRNITFINNSSINDIIKLVNVLPENSLVFVSSLILDQDYVPYFNTESIRIISRETKVPVFHYNNIGVGYGSIGGYILSFNKVGQQIGESAVKILNGTNPNSIDLTQKDYYDYIFDWRKLKQFSLINSELIPEESTILFEEISFIDKYKWIGGVVLLFIIIQTFLIVNLVRLNRNQKLMTKKIIENQIQFREFLHEDRGLRLGQIAASLSHELNQPLTAILSNAQAGINFINSNNATPELLKEILQKIVENDKRTASILNSIRGMLKLENREKEKIELNSLINEVKEVFQSEVNKNSIQLNLNLSSEPVYIIADGVQIQQVLLNLLLNASQAFQKPLYSNKIITINEIISKDFVTIEVCDNGIGIDESIKDKLFRPFFTFQKDGTGIGLTICRSIIEDHQGKIWAENIFGGGAKFSFSLNKIKDE